MKKFLTLISMLICVFGLTACGGEKPLTDYEKQKEYWAIEQAKKVITMLDEKQAANEWNELQKYTPEELEDQFEQRVGIIVNGKAVKGMFDSFAGTCEEIGGIKEIGNAEAKFESDQIVVTVDVHGNRKEAEAEVILSNDYFLKLESASLNTKSTMADSMKKAALNTLLGMGTVFTVLILIAVIIACFGIIPKIQASFDAKKTAKEAEKTVGIDNAVAQITGLEESAGAGDDLELIAVIAAAIAASEGAASADGFVVRSIRRRRAY